jgi:hypothetical protein
MVDPVRLGSDRAAAEVGRVAIGLQARAGEFFAKQTQFFLWNQ